MRTLLLGAGLESDQSALAELKRWGRLLTDLRAQPNELREATVEALMARGVPEASALLAVDTVAGRVSTTTPSAPPPGRLTASVASLDFGTLPPGQGATAEFEVQGGPGQVVVESDQVRITPQRFEAGTTRVRVEVRPMQSGVLWTTLRLVTAGETVEVPVVAQWQEKPSSEPRVPEWAAVQPLPDRRLPVYFLVDTSASMAGAPIESVHAGLEQFRREVIRDPLARDVVKVGIITFGEQVQMLTPGLVPAEHLKVSELVASKTEVEITRLDLAFELLRGSFDRDVIRPGRGGPKGDWRPVVFVLVDGEPTDEEGRLSDAWKAKRDVLINRPRGQAKPASIVAIGCGSDVDTRTLQAISTDPSLAFRVGDAALSFVDLFQFISQSIDG